VTRLGLIDRAALIFTFVPIWAFWFALFLNNLSCGRVAAIPISVSAPRSPDNYPTLLGFWEAPLGGLHVGDRLLKVGQADLRGVWPVGFAARAHKETDASLHLPLTFMRAGLRHKTLLSLRADPFPWVWAVINVSFVGFAILLILRRPNSRLIRATFLMTMVLSLRFIPFSPGSESGTAGTYLHPGRLRFCLRPHRAPLGSTRRLPFSGGRNTGQRTPANVAMALRNSGADLVRMDVWRTAGPASIRRSDC
jgi:hypothetical protein